MLDSPLITITLVVALVLLAWYFLGMQYNIRRGRRALRWLEQGIPVIGEKAALNWSGVSSAEIQLQSAKEPYRTAEISVELKPREIPFWQLWWHGTTRDTLIFRGQLRVAPRFDLVAHTSDIRDATQLKRTGTGQWVAVQGGLANDMTADIRGSISPYAVNRLIVQTTLDGMKLTHLIVHRSAPNIEVRYRLPPFEQVSAQRVFTSLRQLGEEISQV